MNEGPHVRGCSGRVRVRAGFSPESAGSSDPPPPAPPSAAVSCSAAGCRRAATAWDCDRACPTATRPRGRRNGSCPRSRPAEAGPPQRRRLGRRSGDTRLLRGRSRLAPPRHRRSRTHRRTHRCRLNPNLPLRPRRPPGRPRSHPRRRTVGAACDCFFRRRALAPLLSTTQRHIHTLLSSEDA